MFRLSEAESDRLNALLDKSNLTPEETTERNELLDAHDQLIEDAYVYDQTWECGYLYDGMDDPYMKL